MNTHSQRQVLSNTQTLFNKLVNIINNEEKLITNENQSELDTKITGGVMLNETIDNLIGGNMNKHEQSEKTTQITKELNENLFEGGNKHEDKEDDYTMFLHRLRTKQLYTPSTLNELDKQVSISGGKASENQQTETIDVLPMFPYLVRY